MPALPVGPCWPAAKPSEPASPEFTRSARATAAGSRPGIAVHHGPAGSLVWRSRFSFPRRHLPAQTGLRLAGFNPRRVERTLRCPFGLALELYRPVIRQRQKARAHGPWHRARNDPLVYPRGVLPITDRRRLGHSWGYRRTIVPRPVNTLTYLLWFRGRMGKNSLPFTR